MDDRAESYGLRFYQAEAFRAVERELGRLDQAILTGPSRSTLVYMPTGMGKTRLFSAIAAECSGRVLILAHRKELIYQARNAIESLTGTFVDVEMAERSSYFSRIVVGSVDSVRQPSRLDRLRRDGFALVIIDECHRSLAAGYQSIIDWFRHAKVLGVTATPDRGDGRALLNTFDTVAHEVTIMDAVEWGYLVEPRVQRIFLEDLDLDAVPATSGELSQGRLDKVVMAQVGAICNEVVKRVEPGRQGVMFLPGVVSGALACDTLNELRPGSAVFVCGQTPPEERQDLMRRYKGGEVQWLVNVDVASEGFDHPPAEVCVLAAMTCVRNRYVQRVGRVLRPLPSAGIDKLKGPDLSEERRKRIAASAKPTATVLDFYGASQKHSLIRAEEIFAGPGEEKLVAHIASKGDGGEAAEENPIESLAKAREELAQAAKDAQRVKARKVRAVDVDPYASDPDAAYSKNRSDTLRARPGQLSKLRQLGVTAPPGCTAKKASELIREAIVAQVDQADRDAMAKYRGIFVPPKYGTPVQFRSARSYIERCEREGGYVDPGVLQAVFNVGRR